MTAIKIFNSLSKDLDTLETLHIQKIFNYVILSFKVFCMDVYIFNRFFTFPTRKLQGYLMIYVITLE